jgi:hypothetical protein
MRSITRRDLRSPLRAQSIAMTQPTLLARLYKFIVESRCVRLSDLRGRFPEEFTEQRERNRCDSLAADPCAAPASESNKKMGRLSQGLSDALRFLLAEEVVVVNRRGRLVHVSAWKEKSQIRIERTCLGTRESSRN